MIQPMINPDRKPQTTNFQVATFLFNIKPETRPIKPKANICQGVQAPCPKYIFEVKAMIVPIKKPVSGPLTIAPKIKMNNSGLTAGIAAKIILPTTAKAQIIAIKTISREVCGDFSNFQKYIPKVKIKNPNENSR